MESQAPQLIKNAGETVKRKKWYVLGGLLAFGLAIGLGIAYIKYTTKEESAVLMLSTKKDTNVPMVISLKGPYDDDLNFKYEEGTEAKQSCATVLNGEMYVLSGSRYIGMKPTDNYKQISKVGNCKLKKVGELPFDIDDGYDGGGGCNTFHDPRVNEFRIMLCFYDGPGRACMTYDGAKDPSAKNFDKTITLSEFNHRWVNALSSYHGMPFITGSDEPGGLWTEYLDMESGNWTQGPNYPFGEGDESLDPRIRNYATTYTEDSVYIIGGRTNDYDYHPDYRQMTAIIAQYNNDTWTEVGRLEKPRESHAAITVDGMTMVFGGAYLDNGATTFTEQWNLTLFEIDWNTYVYNASLSEEEQESYKIDPTELNPALRKDYRDGIALFAVQQTNKDGYCAKD